MITRLQKRCLRSFYYDRILKRYGKATSMPSYPFSRPRRYLFLGQFVTLSEQNAYKIIVEKEMIKTVFFVSKDNDLPF